MNTYTEWDLRVGYEGIPWLGLTVGVENVFDNAPPTATSLQGFSQQYHDMRGRFFYAQARLRPWRGAEAR